MHKEEAIAVLKEFSNGSNLHYSTGSEMLSANVSQLEPTEQHKIGEAFSALSNDGRATFHDRIGEYNLFQKQGAFEVAKLLHTNGVALSGSASLGLHSWIKQ